APLPRGGALGEGPRGLDPPGGPPPPRLEPALEPGNVHGLAVRAERADRHRVGRRVAAELAEPHVDRGLTALEPGRHLVRPRARLLALDPATGIAPLARAEATADPLAVLARLGRLQAGETELVGHRSVVL